jgi:hypothetical protein
MARDMHQELAFSRGDPTGKVKVACLALYPGVVRTERMIEILDSGEWTRRTGLAAIPEYQESPFYQGQIIAALHADADGKLLSHRSGKVCVSAELGQELNIADRYSNIIPPSLRNLKYLIPAVILGRYGNNDIPEALRSTILKYAPNILLPMSFMSGGPPK